MSKSGRIVSILIFRITRNVFWKRDNRKEPQRRKRPRYMLNYNKYVDIAMVSFCNFAQYICLACFTIKPFFKVDMNLRKSQSFLPIFVKPICVWLTLLLRRGLVCCMLELRNARKLTACERRDKSSEISRSFLSRACLDFSFLLILTCISLKERE